MEKENNLEDNDNQREIGEVDENILNKEIELDDQKITVERNLKDVLKYDKSLKIVLLGETMVGKSSIVHRICEGKFIDHLSPTISIEYFNYTTRVNKDLIIRMQIWDTAGQEKYRALTKIFYKDAGVAILVYDITRKESFEEIQKYWYNQVKEYAPKNISK